MLSGFEEDIFLGNSKESVHTVQVVHERADFAQVLVGGKEERYSRVGDLPNPWGGGCGEGVEIKSPLRNPKLELQNDCPTSRMEKLMNENT